MIVYIRSGEGCPGETRGGPKIRKKTQEVISFQMANSWNSDFGKPRWGGLWRHCLRGWTRVGCIQGWPLSSHDKEWVKKNTMEWNPFCAFYLFRGGHQKEAYEFSWHKQMCLSRGFKGSLTFLMHIRRNLASVCLSEYLFIGWTPVHINILFCNLDSLSSLHSTTLNLLRSKRILLKAVYITLEKWDSSEVQNLM